MNKLSLDLAKIKRFKALGYEHLIESNMTKEEIDTVYFLLETWKMQFRAGFFLGSFLSGIVLLILFTLVL